MAYAPPTSPTPTPSDRYSPYNGPKAESSTGFLRSSTVNSTVIGSSTVNSTVIGSSTVNSTVIGSSTMLGTTRSTSSPSYNTLAKGSSKVGQGFNRTANTTVMGSSSGAASTIRPVSNKLLNSNVNGIQNGIKQGSRKMIKRAYLFADDPSSIELLASEGDQLLIICLMLDFDAEGEQSADVQMQLGKLRLSVGENVLSFLDDIVQKEYFRRSVATLTAFFELLPLLNDPAFLIGIYVQIYTYIYVYIY
jgi:hypothetical protein